MRKILIVDDEYIVRVGIRSFLDWEKYGYVIVGETADGQSALKKIEECKPDIVLTDLKMDGMDGFELIRICKKRWPSLLFVVLSSYDDGPNVKRAMKLGASDYIFKLTSKPEELLKILNELPYENTAGKMETIVRKNLSGIKEQLIQKATQSYFPDRGSLQHDFEQLGLTMDFSKPYRVLLVDFSNGEENIETPTLTKYALENMAQELVEGQLGGEVFLYAGNKILVLFPDEDNKNIVNEQAEVLFLQLTEYTKRYLGIELRGILSERVEDMECLPTAVSNCLKGLRSQPTRSSKLHFAGMGFRPEIEEVCRRVEKNLAYNYTVKTAAEMCNMSESYFSHLFKKELGMSFVEYVNQRRIQKAADLLVHTSLRIGEIAQQVGLDNPNYFSTLFRKYKEQSPLKYRVEHQKAEK